MPWPPHKMVLVTVWRHDDPAGWITQHAVRLDLWPELRLEVCAQLEEAFMRHAARPATVVSVEGAW